jgi:serine phosphatase RsbU (regulator of sigma subunit)
MKNDDYTPWVEQQYPLAVIILALLTIIFQPAFHYILQLVPDAPPDSLALRFVSAGVAVAVLALVLIKPLRRYAVWLQIVNAATALIVVHQLVLNSNNHPMYLAASLTAVYGAQVAFLRLRDWLIAASAAFGYYVVATIVQHPFATTNDFLPPLFFAANYLVCTALMFLRDRLQQQDFRSRIELQRNNRQLTALSTNLQNDLVLARDIQESLLPPASPGWQRYDLACYSQPAREVGGDFYSYYAFADNHIAVAIGDVSGKGVAAALLMATSLSLFNASLGRRGQPALRMARLDNQLVPYGQSRDLNCALCYVELDGNLLTIINAAGIPPYIRRGNGTVEWPDAWGFALGHGLGAQMGYQPVQCSVQRGDTIVLVSDGLVEARNARGVMYGFDRLQRDIANGPTGRAQAMIDHLLTRLRKFAGRTEPHDDITIAVLRVG